jgi:hypothetical protein
VEGVVLHVIDDRRVVGVRALRFYSFVSLGVGIEIPGSKDQLESS